MESQSRKNYLQKGLIYLAAWVIAMSILLLGYLLDGGFTVAAEKSPVMFWGVSTICILFFTLAIFFLYTHFVKRS